MLRHFFILLILIYASYKDLKSLEIPDFCFVLILFFGWPFTTTTIVHFFCVTLVYIIIIFLASLFNKPVPIGMGDAKIFASLASTLGLSSCFKTFCAASITAGIYAAILLLTRRRKINTTQSDCFAFAPFILIGYLIVQIYYLLP